jgi:type VI secretion system secreted protein Hcp
MSAFVKLGDIKGEATDEDHKDWVLIESMSSPMFRSIPEGAKDTQRTKGETTLGDIVLIRQMDKSTTKIQEACANGTFMKEVEIHFCSTMKNKEEPYYTVLLKNVILTSYGLHANSSGEPLPSEEVTLGYTEVEWTYHIIDPETGDNKGKVPTKYNPGKGRS